MNGRVSHGMFLLLALLPGVVSEDPCAALSGDDDVPCVHVPPCAAGNATLAPFWLIDTPAGAPWVPPLQSTSATLCFDDVGLHFSIVADDTDVWTNATQVSSGAAALVPRPITEIRAQYVSHPSSLLSPLSSPLTPTSNTDSRRPPISRPTADDRALCPPPAATKKCGEPVFSLGDVLEVFAAPVGGAHDAPRFYQETDVAPSGAAWAATIEIDDDDAKANATNCLAPAGGGCPALAPHQIACDDDAGGAAAGAPFANLTDLTIAAAARAAGWHAALALPWDLWAPFFGDDVAAASRWPTWRVNAYRYDFPRNRSSHELSGWSPTHTGSFHAPARFGVVVLDNPGAATVSSSAAQWEPPLS